MNQAEVNIRDHAHGVSSVSAILSSEDVVGILNAATPETDAVNTTAETDLYTFTIPAATLGTNRGVRLTLIGDYINNTGSNQTISVRVYYGATVFLSAITVTLAAGATRRAFMVKAELFAHNLTNQQMGGGVIRFGIVGSAAGSAGASDDYLAVFSPLAEDSTAAKVIKITGQHGAANVNLSIRGRSARLEQLN